MVQIVLILALCAPQDNALARAKETACANNLRQLWTLQTIYMSQFGGRQKQMPRDTGRAFWLALSRTQPPLIDLSEGEVFVCPFSAEKPREGFTTYRGPAANVNSLSGGDPVGACVGLHPNKRILVLLKSGEILSAGPDDPAHEKALKGTLFMSQDGLCRALLDRLAKAVDTYQADQDAYPPSGIAALAAKLKEKGPGKQPYFEFAKDQLNAKGEVLDPWGRPLVYVNNADKSAPAGWKPKNPDSFDLYSLGPNGKDEQGGGDDLSR